MLFIVREPQPEVVLKLFLIFGLGQRYRENYGEREGTSRDKKVTHSGKEINIINVVLHEGILHRSRL